TEPREHFPRTRDIRFYSTHRLRHGFVPADRRTSSSMTFRSTIKTKAPVGAFRQEALRVRGWGASIPSDSLTRTAVISSLPPHQRNAQNQDTAQEFDSLRKSR